MDSARGVAAIVEPLGVAFMRWFVGRNLGGHFGPEKKIFSPPPQFPNTLPPHRPRAPPPARETPPPGIFNKKSPPPPPGASNYPLPLPRAENINNIRNVHQAIVRNGRITIIAFFPLFGVQCFSCNIHVKGSSRHVSSVVSF